MQSVIGELLISVLNRGARFSIQAMTFNRQSLLAVDPDE